MTTPTIGAVIHATMPALVAVFQPAFGCYHVFMTGGLRDASQWMRGNWQGWSSMGGVPHGSVKVSRGVYSLPNRN